MKINTLAAAALLATLSIGAAHAADIVNLDATKGSPTNPQVDAATVKYTFQAGTYNVSVIDNLAGKGYNGYNYNTGPLIREAFDFSFDNGATVDSVDTVSSTGKFNSYASAADALAAFATGPYSIYQPSGAKYDATVIAQVGQLQFTFAKATDVLFGIPDNLFTDNTGGVSLAITAAVPEPETYALMLAGLGALAFMARRRNNA